MSEILHVRLGERGYPIYIGGGLAAAFAKTVSKLKTEGRRVAVIADAAVARRQPKLLKHFSKNAVAVLLLKGGEKTKSLRELGRIHDWMAGLGLDRHSVVVAIGGGVIGDLVGFAAATYLRGIDYIQVPTTLLAMVDSSVGGKTGINIAAGKNLVGAFWQPRAVFADTDFLRTLPKREFAAGMAEVVKYGLLGDAKLFARIERGLPWDWKHKDLPGVIRECCALKAAIVADDERETKKSGGRALLNLGHTFAHAIENVAGYGKYLHGEAVGVGLVQAAKLSMMLGWLAVYDAARIKKIVGACGLPVRLRGPLSAKLLMAAMKRDKKVRGGKLRFVALKSIGKAVTVDGVSEKLIQQLWREAGAT